MKDLQYIDMINSQCTTGDNPQESINRDFFEEILKVAFPECRSDGILKYKPSGIIKYVDQHIRGSYHFINITNNNEMGRLILDYRKGKTEVTVEGRNPLECQILSNYLIKKTKENIHGIEQRLHVKHQVDPPAFIISRFKSEKHINEILQKIA
jgi:hypothetical protein